MMTPMIREYSAGRYLVGRVPHGRDLTDAIAAICQEHQIRMGAFTLIGAVTSATVGAYDQKQQVYVTFAEERPLEIIACTGNISMKGGAPFVHAHILLGDERGQTIGGHLFSPTRIYAGEICLQEFTGPPLERTYDETTGLMLWNGDGRG